jgi:hypothetical protein
MPPKMTATNAMPPTTPPAIAPAGADLDLDVELTEELGDEVVLPEAAGGAVGIADDGLVLLVDVAVVVVIANIASRLVLLNPPDGAVAVAPPDPLQNGLSAFWYITR